MMNLFVDLATSQRAVPDQSPSLSRRLWMVCGIAVAFLGLLTTLAVVFLLRHGRLLGEISTPEAETLATLQEQTAAMVFAIFVLGIAATVGLTLLLGFSLRFRARPSLELAGPLQRDSATGPGFSDRRERPGPRIDRERKAWEGEEFREGRREKIERSASQAVWVAERIELLRRVREQATELVAAHEEIARTARAKDEFVASMSHELRSPLHAVLGLSEALRGEVHGTLSDQQRHFLRNIEDSGRQLLGLINDILDIARVGTDKLRLDLGSVAVAELCRSSIAAVADMAEDKNLKLVAKIDSQVEVIQADERRFRQILVNLLSNAVKFNSKGGTVGLRVEGDAQGGVVRFTVWDTGIGITPEDLQRLFRPFVQVDGRLARRYEGTGLGLALTFHLAELHRGGICVESLPGRGSRFSVSVPWRALSEEVLEPGAEPALENAPLILLVEQNQAEIDAVTVSLEGWGARVMLAETRQLAIQLAREELPSIILLKVAIPGIQDLELAQAVRDDPRLRHLPIIALTALSVPGERERCLAAGVDDFLTVPMRDGELLAAIQSQLGRRARCQKLLFTDPVLELSEESSSNASYQPQEKSRRNSDAA